MELVFGQNHIIIPDNRGKEVIGVFRPEDITPEDRSYWEQEGVTIFEPGPEVAILLH